MTRDSAPQAPPDDFQIGTVSFDEPDLLGAAEDENVDSSASEYTAEEWPAWEAGVYDSYETGGATIYDEDSYYEEESAYSSDDGYE
ncbi:hypothetical protein CYMTET_5035 [Cymbomonas tetramitiformis]|uniref:Uncharacterized protein n=1 Tax=Cymbomonas tetramitiformis TaxID=36881 RepID=A0AAE0H1U5_9CHLO|nr:hypothetical protein CYMTET_5035 [Cymbomonas tetramitiformis]